MHPMPPPGAKKPDAAISVDVAPMKEDAGRKDESYFKCPSCGAQLCAEPMEESNREHEQLGEM